MKVIEVLQAQLEPWMLFLADDPMLRAVQGGMLLLGSVVIFLVFYTTRDILIRTHSFVWMFFSILLVAALPVVGFLLYLLIRPSRTLKEKEMEKMLKDLSGTVKKMQRKSLQKKGGIVKKEEEEKQ